MHRNARWALAVPLVLLAFALFPGEQEEALLQFLAWKRDTYVKKSPQHVSPDFFAQVERLVDKVDIADLKRRADTNYRWFVDAVRDRLKNFAIGKDQAFWLLSVLREPEARAALAAAAGIRLADVLRLAERGFPFTDEDGAAQVRRLPGDGESLGQLLTLVRDLAKAAEERTFLLANVPAFEKLFKPVAAEWKLMVAELTKDLPLTDKVKFRDSLGPQDVADYFKALARITPADIETLVGFRDQGKLASDKDGLAGPLADVVVDQGLSRLADYAVGGRLFTPAETTESAFEKDAPRFADPVRRLLGPAGFERYRALVKRALAGAAATNTGAPRPAYLWNWLLVLAPEKKDETAAELDAAVARLTNERLLFDTAPGPANLLSGELTRFAARGNLFKYWLAFVLRRGAEYTNHPAVNDSLYARFTNATAAFATVDAAGFGGKTVRAQLLDYVVRLWKKQGAAPLVFNRALWDCLVSPPDVNKGWQALLADNAARLDWDTFTAGDALGWCLTNVFRADKPQLDTKAPGARLFLSAYLERYLADERRGGAFEDVLARLEKASPVFYDAVMAWAGAKLRGVMTDKDFADRKRRLQLYRLFPRLAKKDPKVYDLVYGYAADEFAKMAPAVRNVREGDAPTSFELAFFRVPTRYEVVFDYGADSDAFAALDALIEHLCRSLNDDGKGGVPGSGAPGPGGPGPANAADTARAAEIKRRLIKITGDRYLHLSVAGKLPPLNVYRYASHFLPRQAQDARAGDVITSIKTLKNFLYLVRVLDARELSLFLADLAKTLAANPGAKTETEERFLVLLEGVRDFFYDSVTPALAREINKLTLALRSRRVAEQSVKALMKVIYNAPEKDSKVLAEDFTSFYVNEYMKAAGAADSYPSLISDVTKVYLFRYRQEKGALSRFFVKLFERYMDKAEADAKVRNNYLVSMLVLFREIERAGIVALLAGREKEFRDQVTANYYLSREPECLYFLYYLYDAKQFSAVLTNREVRGIVETESDFLRHLRVLKEIFRENWAALSSRPADATLSGIDSQLRGLLFDKYAEFRRPGRTNDQELAAKREAVYLFFLNEIEINKGDFLNRNNIYFPVSEISYPGALHAKEQEIFRHARGTNVAAADGRPLGWFDFCADALRFFLARDREITKKNYAGMMVYLGHALYLQVKQMVLDRDNHLKHWARIRDEIYVPILGGEIFQPDGVAKVLSMRYIDYSETGVSAKNGLDFFLNQLNGVWQNTLTGRDKEPFLDLVRDLLVRFVNKEYDSPEFYYRFVIPYYELFAQKMKLGYKHVLAISPKYDEFVSRPDTPKYLIRSFTLSFVARPDLLRLMLEWFSFARDNSMYFRLMPKIRLAERNTALTGDNPGFVPVKWGFYSDAIEVVRPVAARPTNIKPGAPWTNPAPRPFAAFTNRGFLAFDPEFSREPARLRSVPVFALAQREWTNVAEYVTNVERRTLADGRVTNVAVFRTNTLTNVEYRRMARTLLADVRYRLAIAAAPGAAPADERTDLASMNAYLKDNLFVDEDGLFNAVARDTRIVVAKGEAAVDPARLVLFSRNEWLPVRLDRFTFTGLTQYENIFIAETPIEDPERITAFSYASRVELARYPLRRVSRGANQYIAAVRAASGRTISLLDLRKQGRAFYLVVRARSAVGGRAAAWRPRLYPAQLVQEGRLGQGAAAVMFTLPAGAEVTGDDNFALVAVDRGRIAHEAYCLGVDGKTGDVLSFRKLAAMETVLSFAAPLPGDTTRLVIARREGETDFELTAFARPGALAVKTGELYDGVLTIWPDDFRRWRGDQFIEKARGLKLFYWYTQAATGGKPAGAAAAGAAGPLYVFKQAKPGFFDFHADFGSYYYQHFQDGYFIPGKYAPALSNELGKKARRWRAPADVFGKE